jgi:hypothetical protein
VKSKKRGGKFIYGVLKGKEKLCEEDMWFFEHIKGCKHPLIALGATLIGSAGRAPDEIERRSVLKKIRQYLWAFTQKNSIIASGATPIGSTGHAPDEDGKYWLLIRRIIDFIVGNIKQINSLLHSHREGFAISWRNITQRFWVLKQLNKAHDKLIILKPHRRDKKLECHGRKDHEGKTSGSVLCGLVYAHECVLLVNFHIHDAKKNPDGRTRYPKKY